MIEAREVARLARELGDQELAEAFDAAAEIARRNNIDSFAIERFKHKVEEAEEIRPGTDLAGISIGLRAYGLAKKLSGGILQYCGKDGLVLSASAVPPEPTDNQFPHYLKLLVEDPGRNLDILKKVNPSYAHLQNGVVEGLEAASFFLYIEGTPWYREFLSTGARPARQIADITPGLYISIDPLKPDNFGRIGIPSFVRNENGLVLTEPSSATFAPRNNLKAQEFATALLDVLPQS